MIMDASATRPPNRRRLPPAERRVEILSRAISLFAENGFESSTRELARQLGITQPLLYRYFPSKEDLIREVYKEVYLKRWNIEWDQLLCDRSRPLDERLRSFYESYTEAIFSREWMRIYLFSGLKGADINRWYIGLLEERILMRIVKEYRHLAGRDDRESISSDELELAWAFHSGIFYAGVREHIYGLPPIEDRRRMIANTVRLFHPGIQAFYSDWSPSDDIPARARSSPSLTIKNYHSINNDNATRPARRAGRTRDVNTSEDARRKRP